jgi:hypothetical protein
MQPLAPRLVAVAVAQEGAIFERDKLFQIGPLQRELMGIESAKCP